MMGRSLAEGGGAMVAGLELVAGYLIAWATRKARHAGARLDAEADLVIDAELDKLHGLVAAKLGTDSALAKLEETAAAGQEVSERTRRRVTDALADAADDDHKFAGDLAACVSVLEQAIPPTVALAVGERSAAAGGNVTIAAEGGSIAAQTMGDVSLGGPPPDPTRPGRHRG
jgi:hypothetical protein